jgi:hypothetical protein
MTAPPRTRRRSAGHRIDQFGEHPEEYWRSFPRLPENLRRRLPMTFTMTARKGQ